jgi:Flp pilus assembly protein TadD
MSHGKRAQDPSRSAVEQLLDRARTKRLKGDARRALVLLREATCLAEGDARVWTLYAVHCWQLNRRDEGRKAMRQALWLRERQGDHARARVLRQLLLGMEAACVPDELRAA